MLPTKLHTSSTDQEFTSSLWAWHTPPIIAGEWTVVVVMVVAVILAELDFRFCFSSGNVNAARVDEEDKLESSKLLFKFCERGGEGVLLVVDVDARQFVIDDTFFLWLIVKSVLNRLESGGCELKSNGIGFMLDLFTTILPLVASSTICGELAFAVISKLWARDGLDCRELDLCFWVEYIKAGVANCIACCSATFTLRVKVMFEADVAVECFKFWTEWSTLWISFSLATRA